MKGKVYETIPNPYKVLWGEEPHGEVYINLEEEIRDKTAVLAFELEQKMIPWITWDPH